MKPTVYIETSVVSYLTARPSRDLVIAAHQQMTAEWWDQVLPQVAPFVSELVRDEVSQGDQVAAARRLKSIQPFNLLGLSPEIDDLAKRYSIGLSLPVKAAADAYHVALATWHGIDYVVSWNCTHIVGGRVQKILMEINAALDLETPVLCTPEDLMEV